MARYDATVVLAERRASASESVATAPTQIGAPTTEAEALAERLTRDRVHRSLFGELSAAPMIGRYTFLKEIGQGGMGVVCTAYDPKLDRKVAIKLTRALATTSAEGRARILREAQAMAKLSHPNVVQVYEVGDLGDELYVAMEFIDGVDLSQWLAAQPRSWREIQRVFLEAGRGLAAAHAVGLVHRDFKPANVLLEADGRARVGDFGLARASLEDAPARELGRGVSEGEGASAQARENELATPLTATGALVGTPAYMAPETLERGVSDALSDQFSFCVALFEALYGVRPFGGRELGAMVRAIVEDEPTIPAGAQAPSWLHKIALRGLQKRPEQRWPSMEALLAALAMDPAARARGLRRAVLTVSVVSASVAGLGWLAAEARERAELAARAKVAAEAARDEAFEGLRAAVIRSEAEASRARDALRLATLRRFDSGGLLEYVEDPTSAAALLREVEAPEQVRGWRLSAVQALEQPIAKAVLPGWMTVAFTPDGERVLTREGYKAVMVYRADGAGAPLRLGEREGVDMTEVALSPDGARVAIGYRDGQVGVASIDGGATLELRGAEESVLYLNWRGDGEELLVRTGRYPGTRSQRWALGDAVSGPTELPGVASQWLAGGLVLTGGALVRGDGERAAELPEGRLVPTPRGDGVLVVGPKALRLHGLDGAALRGQPALDHGGLLVGEESLTEAFFTPDGARVISMTSAERIFVWDRAAGRLLREIEAPPPPEAGMLQWGLSAAVSPDGASLARGYADRTVRVWDLEGRGAPLVLRGHLHHPSELAFSPDSRTLATSTIYTRGFSRTDGLSKERGDFDQTIRLWSIPDARGAKFSAFTRRTAESDARWIARSPWTPDGQGLLLTEGTRLRWVDAYGVERGAVEVAAADAPLSEPIFVADGSVIFEAAERWLRWRWREGGEIEAIAKPSWALEATRTTRERGKAAADLSPGGERVYYVSGSRRAVRVYRFDTHELIRELPHDAAVERLLFSPRGDRILTITGDNHARIWSLEDEAPPEVFAGEGPIFARWSEDGAFAALTVRTAVKEEVEVMLWRPGAEVERRWRGPGFVSTIQVSPDGRELALLGSDDRVRLLSSSGALTIREMEQVDAQPGPVEFSSDGAWLISRASNAAFVWSTATGEVVRALRSPERQLSFVGFDPTGARVMTIGRDGIVTITPFDRQAVRVDLRERLRAATSYCTSYERRRVDLKEPPALAWANYSACERSFGRTPAEGPPEAG